MGKHTRYLDRDETIRHRAYQKLRDKAGLSAREILDILDFCLTVESKTMQECMVDIDNLIQWKIIGHPKYLAMSYVVKIKVNKKMWI